LNSKPIRRLVIVNRGEAAMRAIRAVKALRALEGSDLESVVLYTDVDREAPFVRHADRAIRLDSSRGAVAAYLDREKVMHALAEAEADAVWPGWGFIAEDPEFADQVVASGLRFLGPTGDVMRALGDKIDAKRVAEKSGVPVLAWSGAVVADPADAAAVAARIGYPVVIKAAAGGGGRGIRMVDSDADIEASFRSAAAEALSAFGDDRLFVERRLPQGRHIEVQFASDSHGHSVSLGCRDCSVQRRHQKVVEEAPPPGLPGSLLAQLESAAIGLVTQVGYVGVGTVEFLVSDGEFFFLEVNPRLQVEHGITEELTGIDLVQLQIRIARGETLPPISQRAALVAIEARVCAEDPQADFLPTPGKIALFEPALGPRMRLDSGVAAGSEVPAEFDSLIAKLIAVGDSREDARARLSCALTDFELVVAGGATNKGYLIDILEAAPYRSGTYDTEWLDREPELRNGSDEFAVEALIVASILCYQRSRDGARQKFYADPATLSPASIPASTGQRVDLTMGSESYGLQVFGVGAWRYRVHMDGRVAVATLREERANSAILELAGRSLRVVHDITEQGLRIEIESRPYRFSSELAGQVRSSTPAVVLSIQVKPKDVVTAGQSLGLLEAMKTEIDFKSPVSGVVKEVLVRAGQQVFAGELMLVIEAEAPGTGEAPREHLELPPYNDPLDIFFQPAGESSEQSGAEDPTIVDLLAAEQADAASRRRAMDAARDEVRRVLMGYDVNPLRGERLVSLLEAPLPEGLSESFRWELAEIRHDLTLFADIEQLFVRAQHASVSGDLGPSNHARLRAYMRRMTTGGAGISEEFLTILRHALSHYGVNLEYCEALERAVLRLVASQLGPQLRRRLVAEILRRTHALAASGLHLGHDSALADALASIAGLRGLVPDALADHAIETSYTIFEGPELERQAERTTNEVEAWLSQAESEPTPPPSVVLVHLANAPRSVFDRVGRWIGDTNPLRSAVAVAAHVCRLYAPSSAPTHTSGTIGAAHVERLDLRDGRTILGSVAPPEQIGRTLARLASAAEIVGHVDAIELMVPAEPDEDLGQLHKILTRALTALDRSVSTDRLTLTRLCKEDPPEHLSLVPTNSGWEEATGLHGLHPETAARIDLDRLRAFDLERLESPDDIYCFSLRATQIPGDERIFVLADCGGLSPYEALEATLHIPSFERAFFEAARTLRSHLGLRDPSRRLQWNRIAVFASPMIFLDDEVAERLAKRLAPDTRHLGLEKVIVRLNVLDRAVPDEPAKPVEVVIADPTGSNMELSWRGPHHEALEPARDYERKVVDAKRRKLVYPYEIIRLLTGGSGENGAARSETDSDLPPGSFEEFDLGPAEPGAVSVAGRAYGLNESSVVFGIIDTPTEKNREGMKRVLILSDPTAGMGALAAPECDRIVAAIDLAEERGVPVEWVPVSSGARIAMDSGTENLDATARVVRRIVTFTQSGGSIHIIVAGVNIGAQSYFNALSTMLSHTRGALIMTPGASMVLTGRAALEASGSVSAEDEAAIGGFERIMGPNGEAQYFARNIADAYRILYEHYRYTFVAPGESTPRPFPTQDQSNRSLTDFICEPEEGHDFRTLGEIFDPATNLDRKRPFSMRLVMESLIDQDGGHLERWRSWQGAETAIVWDAHLGGHAICLIGIESRSLDREGYSPADGPAAWTGGTLFPLSSKKLARALTAASGNRPVVLLANLSGFDGLPESMRKLQLEYGAQIARAVVNFEGPLLFMVVSRYHGGAYVVFSGALNDGLRPAALAGSFASVIGGTPAATVVFAREVRARVAADPRITALRRETGFESREKFDRAWQEVTLEKQVELAAQFDAVHTVERARDVGSLEAIVEPADMRRYLIDELRANPAVKRSGS
jgi:acetyl/propionyl-CoA carboxylase alpha subunit/acetyl-CoA carboxylase carboxyltransferase component